MATKTSKRTRVSKRSNANAASKAITFTATLHRPVASAIAAGEAGGWTFLNLPKQASSQLPSRSRVSVAGDFNGVSFQATLEPDGKGGHWLKVDRRLREAAKAEAGDVIALVITPLSPDQEPEPEVPADLRKALAAAPAKSREVWADITPIARRDWIHWITSGKRAETRGLRVAKACDMLAKGKRRACCFDRSGMYDKSLSCPVAE